MIVDFEFVQFENNRIRKEYFLPLISLITNCLLACREKRGGRCREDFPREILGTGLRCGGQSNIYVHHIHAEGACFVWVVEDIQHAAVREWAFLTEFERQLVDSFVSSLRSQAHII